MAVKAKDSNLWVNIDPKKVDELYKVAAKKGLTINQLNVSIGHANGFLKQCCYSGNIKKSDLILVKTLYDVDLELHEPDKKEVKPPTVNTDELVTVIRANNVIGKHLEEQNSEIIKLLGEIKDKLKIIANTPYGTNTQTPHTYKNYTGVKDGKLQFTTKEERDNAKTN